jgi:uncharacterized protein
MKVELSQKVKRGSTVIEGFPGYGLVGTIATEFLIEHLKAKPIGRIWSEKLVPVASIHNGRVIEPLGVFYDESNNIIILHALSAVKGLEWELADALIELCNKIGAENIISIEGIPGKEGGNEERAYYFTQDNKDKDKFKKLGLDELKEGMVMGVTGAMLLKSKKVNAIFVEGHSNLADSMAAAKIVEILDKYLGLNVDYEPLKKAAQNFEKNLKALMNKAQQIEKKDTGKSPSYFG